FRFDALGVPTVQKKIGDARDLERGDVRLLVCDGCCRPVCKLRRVESFERTVLRLRDYDVCRLASSWHRCIASVVSKPAHPHRAPPPRFACRRSAPRRSAFLPPAPLRTPPQRIPTRRFAIPRIASPSSARDSCASRPKASLRSPGHHRACPAI